MGAAAADLDLAATRFLDRQHRGVSVYRVEHQEQDIYWLLYTRLGSAGLEARRAIVARESDEWKLLRDTAGWPV